MDDWVKLLNDGKGITDLRLNESSGTRRLKLTDGLQTTFL